MGSSLHFCDQQLPLVNKLIYATRFKERFINAPVEEVITEGQNTNVICDVKFASPVKIQDGVKRSGMSVKEIFIFLKVIIRAECHYLFMSLTLCKQAKSGIWE